MITLYVTLKHFPWPLVWIFEMVITLSPERDEKEEPGAGRQNMLGASFPRAGTWSLRQQSLHSRLPEKVGASPANYPLLTYCSHKLSTAPYRRFIHVHTDVSVFTYQFVKWEGSLTQPGTADTVARPELGTCIYLSPHFSDGRRSFCPSDVL